MVSASIPQDYTEEASNLSKTITGVPTSMTAFIGRALRGVINEPINIDSLADYERIFGGLWIDSMMSYAVRDFFYHGGRQAIIIRLYKDDPLSSAKAVLDLPTSHSTETIKLIAVNEGSWGTRLKASVNYDSVDSSLFNLIIDDDGSHEEFLNISMDTNHPQNITSALQQSELVRVSGVPPTERPVETSNLSNDSTMHQHAPRIATGGSDGLELDRVNYLGNGRDTGIYALNKTGLFNLLCIPPAIRASDTDPTVYQQAMTLCADKRAMLLVDSPIAWNTMPIDAIPAELLQMGLTGEAARNAALYYPHIQQFDPMNDNQIDSFVPCGAVAGIIARIDTARGVWKSPAGLEAALKNTQGLERNLTDEENGILNPHAINCLRSFPDDQQVIWGARTLAGDDNLGDEYKYIAVRRLALYIEESIQKGTEWVVFESNDEPLWEKIRQSIDSFLNHLFRQGAFQGHNPHQCYFVKCGKETTRMYDIDNGLINIEVGIAPLKPAEFIIIKIQHQSAGGSTLYHFQSSQKSNIAIPQQEKPIRDNAKNPFTLRTRHQLKRFITSNLPKSNLSQPSWNKITLFSNATDDAKHQAASLIADAFDFPLYRVNLAQLINKGLVSTEEALQNFFSRQKPQFVLLFDEADALFGKRTSVKGARGRYAQGVMMTLFTCMEKYNGICIIGILNPHILKERLLRRLRHKVNFKDKNPFRIKRPIHHPLGIK